MKVLIAGISSYTARRLALDLLEKGHDVIGLDRRPWPDRPRAIELHELDVRKRPAEDVFRRVRPQAVVHAATVASLFTSRDERYRINLEGTRAIFAHCEAYGVEHAVFVGRHTYYGAGPDTPLYHVESEPPQALNAFPELADLVAADLYAANVIWRVPRMTTTVLRLVYTLGPGGTGTLATYLRGRAVPTVLGFDPLFQFLHEDDAASALGRVLESRPRGIFNVAGPQPLPLSVVIREADRVQLPLPEPMLRFALGRFGLPALPTGALMHIKFPVVVDHKAFSAATGWKHTKDELETVRDFARAYPAAGR